MCCLVLRLNLDTCTCSIWVRGVRLSVTSGCLDHVDSFSLCEFLSLKLISSMHYVTRPSPKLVRFILLRGSSAGGRFPLVINSGSWLELVWRAPPDVANQNAERCWTRILNCGTNGPEREQVERGRERSRRSAALTFYFDNQLKLF